MLAHFKCRQSARTQSIGGARQSRVLSEGDKNLFLFIFFTCTNLVGGFKERRMKIFLNLFLIFLKNFSWILADFRDF